MTHLLIDAVGARRGGGATIALAALHAALDHPQITRVTFAALPQASRGFMLPAHPRLRVIEPPATRYAARLLWHTLGLGAAAHALGADRVLDLNALGHTFGTPRAALLQQLLILAPPPAGLPAAHTRRLAIVRALTALSARRASVLFAQRAGVAALAGAWLGRPVQVATPHATWHDHEPDAPHEALDRMAGDPAARVLYIGSDLATKRLDLLLAAMRRLRAARSNTAAATLYCTLPPTHPLLAEPGVVGLGHLTRAQTRRAIALSDCVATASQAETVGLPLVEAMEVGRPAVAPDLEYAREIGAGALVLARSGDINALADAISRALDEPAKYVAAGIRRHAALAAAAPYAAMIDALLACEAAP
jgi:glycosyltransferase involved in cell wall biosynthesis